MDQNLPTPPTEPMPTTEPPIKKINPLLLISIFLGIAVLAALAAMKLMNGSSQPLPASDIEYTQTEPAESTSTETETSVVGTAEETLQVDFESEALPTVAPEVPVTACGGWEVAGEVRCECDGEISKAASGDSDDVGTYFCAGTCGLCCYDGESTDPLFPRCE